jgi:hypothetical protein
MGGLETWGGFGNPRGFWKPREVLETQGDFGNLRGFWKSNGVLETQGGFGNLGRFSKPIRILETYPLKSILQIHQIPKILLTRSASFSEDKFSRMLSTLTGKLKGVSRSGKLKTIFPFTIRSSISRNRASSIWWSKTS